MVSLLNGVINGLERAKRAAGRARRFYFSTSAKTMAHGSARLEDLSYLARVLRPRLRHAVDDYLVEFQRRLDELNCRLAEKAVPGERRERVKMLCQSSTVHGRKSLHVIQAESRHARAVASHAPASGQYSESGLSWEHRNRLSPDASAGNGQRAKKKKRNSETGSVTRSHKVKAVSGSSMPETSGSKGKTPPRQQTKRSDPSKNI